MSPETAETPTEDETVPEAESETDDTVDGADDGGPDDTESDEAADADADEDDGAEDGDEDADDDGDADASDGVTSPAGSGVLPGPALPNTDSLIEPEVSVAATALRPSALEPTIMIRESMVAADDCIVGDVFVEDCYHIAVLPGPNQVIVDVGAQIGTAARKFRMHNPGAHIFAIEANPANWDALKANCGGDEFTHLIGAACTYEGGDLEIHSSVYANTENSGGSFVGPAGPVDRSNSSDYRHHYPVIATITIHDILKMVPRIDVLKMDCEGSELSILEHAPLDKIGIMVLETHRNNDQLLEVIARRLGVGMNGNSNYSFDVIRPGDFALWRIANRNWWNRKT